jgi:iron complex outermembrane receptor protein
VRSAQLRGEARLRRVPALLVALCFPLAAAAEEPAPPEPPPPPVIEAPEVTISADRTERNVLDVPGNVTVIDRETIERSGAQNVPELLRREAGLSVTNTTTNPLGYVVEARGFQNGGGNGCHTLVLIDGRRMNEPDLGCPDWSLVPLDQIERIEVVRGPVSAAYGDYGMGGVIQIVTRHGRTEPGVHAIASGRSGAYDTDGGSLWLDGGGGPVTATAFLENETSDSYRDNADFSRRRQELGLRFAPLETATLELQAGYASVHREQPGDLTHPEWDADPRQAEPGSGDNFDDERERYLQAGLTLRPSENVAVELRPFVRRTDQETRLDDAPILFSTDTEIDEHGVTSQVEWSLSLRGRPLRLLGGVDASQQDVDRNSLFDDGVFPFPQKNTSRRKLVGLFFQQELELHEDWLLSAGVRRDRADSEGEEELGGCTTPGACPDERWTIWSPRAALTWRMSDFMSAYASYARGFRYPNLDEAYGFFGFTPGLEPEKSDAYEIGWKLRRPGLALNLALYHMNVSDEIFLDPLTFQNQNLDRVRHRGVEVSASWRAAAALELWGSYTYDDVEIRRDDASPGLEGQRMPITPKHRGALGATVFLPFGFEVGGTARYVGSRPLANDLTGAEDEMPRYATYDARVGWSRALTGHVRLAIDLNAYNLTDRSYAEFGGLSLFDPSDIGYFPAPGRHYVASARIELRR